MKPTDITPYVWNRLLQTFDTPSGTLSSRTEAATAWLAKQTDANDIWNHLLEHEGIVGYGFYLHQLHQHLWHPKEIN